MLRERKRKAEIKTAEAYHTLCAVIYGDDPVIQDAPSALEVPMRAQYEAGTKNPESSRGRDVFFAATQEEAVALLPR